MVDGAAPIYMGSGINGQTVFVHGPAKVVVAKFSTWPEAWTIGRSRRTRLGLTSLAEKIAARG